MSDRFVYYEATILSGNDIEHGDFVWILRPSLIGAEVISTVEVPVVPAQVIVSVPSANLRSGPGTNYQPVGSARQGEVFVVIAQTNDESWYLVENARIGDVWIAASVVTVSDPSIAIPIVITVPAQVTVAPATSQTTNSGDSASVPMPVPTVPVPVPTAQPPANNLTVVEFVQESCNGYVGDFSSGAEKYCASVGTRGVWLTSLLTGTDSNYALFRCRFRTCAL
jgi:hypothetical protein